jgi:hypothetical protein
LESHLTSRERQLTKEEKQKKNTVSLKKNYFVIQIEKSQGKQTNINTWSNSRSEVKTNEMPDAVK